MSLVLWGLRHGASLPVPQFLTENEFTSRSCQDPSEVVKPRPAFRKCLQ